MHILVTAIGSMSAEAVISSLKSSLYVQKVIGCDTYPQNWLPSSRLVDAFFQVPGFSDAHYIEQIVSLCKSERIDAVIPLTDPELDILSGNRALIESQGIRLFISGHESIQTCRDKLNFVSYLKPHRWISTIPTYQLHEVLADSVSFPIIGKPRGGRSSEGLMNFDNIEMVEHSKFQLQDYIFQPQMDGDVFTIDVVRDNFNNCVSVPRKELLRTKNGAGLTVEIQKDHVLVAIANKLAEVLNIKGCVNFEFIFFNQVYYLMDVNPRFSAGVAFSQMAGYDMVKNHLNVFINNKIEPIVEVTNMVLAKGFSDYYM